MLIRYLWPAAAWSLIILLLTLSPGEKLPKVDIFQIDKVVHFFVFGVLMVLSSYGLKKIFVLKDVPSSPEMIAGAYCFGLGIIVEILQLFVPNRSLSAIDIIANSIGVGLGYLVFRLLNRKNLF